MDIESVSAGVPSNGGYVRTEFTITETGPGQCSLRFHYGGKSFRATGESHSLSEEHSASGGPITCSKTSILELGMGLERWLESGELFSWNSGAGHGPRLTLALCRPEGIITRVDKPAFAGTYENTGFFYSSWLYVVDQSCLREAAEVFRNVGAEQKVH